MYISITTLQNIMELGVELQPFTQELVIIEALDSGLEILGTAKIFLQTEVLSSARKFMGVVVITGAGSNKVTLVSLKIMKAWDLIHLFLPLESVSRYCMRMFDNKAEKNYCYSTLCSIQCSESRHFKALIKEYEELRDSIAKQGEGIFEEALEAGDRMLVPPMKIK